MVRITRRDAIKLAATCVVTMLGANMARADSYEGVVQEITDSTIKINGKVYRLGDNKGEVGIFKKGKKGGDPDVTVKAADVKKHVMVDDTVHGRVVLGDSVATIFIK